MQMNMYSIYDSKGETYSKPFYQLNHEVAFRACKDILADPRGDIARHPEDFTLFFVGVFHDDTCEIEIFNPVSLTRFSDLQPEE